MASEAWSRETLQLLPGVPSCHVVNLSTPRNHDAGKNKCRHSGQQFQLNLLSGHPTQEPGMEGEKPSGGAAQSSLL